eukprot:TRINITY_DN8405_c0_g1_i3.p1 TRINITY_DN8405_c0_g1~~TRINITY_DN8405_c0_g1_i3.p1  ORF type:complete len:590 (+),score=192.49 TRINITY_DN8405_c0_g1_i3:35-1771(+)
MSGRIRTEDVITDETKGTDFTQLSIRKDICEGLLAAGYTHPTPIQLKSIPIGLLGVDMIVKSKAGTGKTLIFAVLTLQGIDTSVAVPQSVTITATREIALQIASVVNKVGASLPKLTCHTFIGGTSKKDDRSSLKNCQVVVGSAGRIKDLICDSAMLYAGKVKMFFLDEVDALLGGQETLADINSIFRMLPERKQVCTFSATYTDALMDILKTYMRIPKIISIDDRKISLRGVEEYYKLINVKKEEEKQTKAGEVLRIINNLPFTQCTVFCNDFEATQDLVKSLCEVGISADCISSRLEQTERSSIIKKFANFNIRVLVSSDLTARGIDMTKVNMILNLDAPANGETYMHRIGRTGRYGSLGLAISIINKSELQAIRQCRSDVNADNELKVLPDDLGEINTAYMEGVLTSKDEEEQFNKYESSRKDGKAAVVPRTARRQVKRKRGAKEEDADSEDGKGDAKRKAPEPAQTPPPAASTPLREARYDSYPTPTPLQERSTAYPSLSPYPQYPQHHQAYYASPMTASPPPGTSVQSTHMKLCQYYERYYRAYYSVATDCLIKTFTGSSIPVPMPPPPAYPS